MLSIYSKEAVYLLDRLQRLYIQESITTVKFQLREVGVRDYVSGGMDGWNKVVRAVQKEGLNICPQLTAAELARLNAGIIGEGEYADILSEPITDRYGRRVFGLGRFGGGLRLHSHWIDFGWHPDGLVVGRIR